MKRCEELTADDLTGLQALGADVLLDGTTVLHAGDALNVGMEGTVGDTMRVADGTTSLRTLTADFANLRHCNHSIYFRLESGCMQNSQITISRWNLGYKKRFNISLDTAGLPP